MSIVISLSFNRERVEKLAKKVDITKNEEIRKYIISILDNDLEVSKCASNSKK